MPASLQTISSSASPATAMELSQNSEIIVKLRDSAIIQQTRGYKPSEIRKQAEQTREKAAAIVRTLLRVKFIAVKRPGREAT
jgi:hypothetical protein